eukprot:10571078-Heterocapsa_arctica.AAC.1
MDRMLSAGAGRFFRLAGTSGCAGACLPRSASLRMVSASSPSMRRACSAKSGRLLRTMGGTVARSPRS